jgi:site-specific recombinase XerD
MEQLSVQIPVTFTDNALTSSVDRIIAGWLVSSCPSILSRNMYKSDLAHFGSYLKELGCNLLEINRQDIQIYMEFLRVSGLAAATRARKLTVLKGLIRTLANENIFPFIEAQKLLSEKAPKVSRDGRTPGLSMSEARLLLDAPSPDKLQGIRDRAILSLLLYTGARRSALCQIKIGHLLHEMGIYYVLLHEKGDRQLRAPLHPEVSQRVQAWIEAAGLSQADPKGFLFRPFNHQGSALIEKPIHDYMIWHIVKKYARKAGLQVDRLDERGICAHSTRVTAITASFEGGAKLEEIQQLVGHKDPRNTLRYRRSSPKDAVNAVMRINY